MQDTVKKSVLPTSDDQTQHQDYITNLDRDVFNLTQLVNNTNNIKFAGSLTSNNNTPASVTFIGDSTAPGNSMYYGTNTAGVKGFYALPTSTSNCEVVNFSRDISLANGTVDYSVTKGTPKCFVFHSATGSYCFASGTDDGTTHGANYMLVGGTIGGGLTDSSIIATDGTNTCKGYVSAVANNQFTITWAKTAGTPVGTCYVNGLVEF